MRFNFKNEVKRLLKKIKATIPKDENGVAPSSFLEEYRLAGSWSDITSMVRWMRREFDATYFYMFKDDIHEEDAEDYDDMTVLNYDPPSGKELCCTYDYLEPIESWERCLAYFGDIYEACSLLKVEQEDKSLLKECLRILWAIFRIDESYDLTWFAEYLKAVYGVCYRALSSYFDPDYEEPLDSKTVTVKKPATEAIKKPMPEQDVLIEKPVQRRGKNWPEDLRFYFEQCHRIFQTSSNRNKKGHRLGPFRVCDEDGSVVEIIPAGQGAVKAVFAYVEANISTLSKGRFLKVGNAAKRQYYDWEKEQPQ